MEGWSSLINGSSLDFADIINRYQGGFFGQDANHAKDDSVIDDFDDEYWVRMRCLFDQVLSAFLDEAISRGCIRPIPVLLGNGQSVDLFKLLWIVRKRGGFDMANGFWNLVVKELDLDVAASASVKLVYFKYLYELEKWLKERCKDQVLENGERQSDVNFVFPPLKLEKCRTLLPHGYDQTGKHDRLDSLGCKKNGKYINADAGKRDDCLLVDKDVNKKFNPLENRCNDNDEKFCNDIIREPCCNDNYDDDDMIMDPVTTKKEFNSRKRKRESLSRMLNWMIQIAKCPCDPSIGRIPPPSKWKNHAGQGQELWVQAIRARDSLLRRRWVSSNAKGSLLQNKHKMHPSMYEEVNFLSDQSADRSRCSERLDPLVKHHLCSHCNSFSVPESSPMSHPKTEVENGSKVQKSETEHLSPTRITLGQSGEHFHKHVAVGPRFQAEVPEWIGMDSESESKWLGTPFWPCEHGDQRAQVELVPIGIGRPDSCSCPVPGSVVCVRFHIAEKRMKLKLELGLVFYHWGFNRMGEEVSLSWTVKEETRFKDMVRSSPPSLGMSLWDHAYRYFPRRTREELVSYYFNVFLVRRRSYQNRVTPKEIDSDDDNSDFGSFAYSYGLVAAKFPGADELICSENKQCTDFQ